MKIFFRVTRIVFYILILTNVLNELPVIMIEWNVSRLHFLNKVKYTKRLIAICEQSEKKFDFQIKLVSLTPMKHAKLMNYENKRE